MTIGALNTLVNVRLCGPVFYHLLYSFWMDMDALMLSTPSIYLTEVYFETAQIKHCFL
jgi:hypothetical protein